jgi:hypothetical protein
MLNKNNLAHRLHINDANRLVERSRQEQNSWCGQAASLITFHVTLGCLYPAFGLRRLEENRSTSCCGKGLLDGRQEQKRGEIVIDVIALSIGFEYSSRPLQGR